MMEFNKSRAYTALNADELKVGSKVYLADCFFSLKKAVEGISQSPIYTIDAILPDFNVNRFSAHGQTWALAYLISEPEEKKLKWTDLKIGDIIRRQDGKVSAMVTVLDKTDTDLHILVGNNWLSDTDLEDWEKVEE